MLELLTEKENIWDYLSSCGLPVIVYGMGNGADKIIDTLSSYGAEVSDIFASDEFVRGHSFRGFRVKKYSEICQSYDNFNVVLAFASHLDNVLDNIKKISSEHNVFAPDVPVSGGGLFTLEYIKENEDKFDFVYNHLADDESKRVYLDVLNFKVSGKVDYLFNSFCDKNEVYRDILRLTDNETIVDLGAYDGDTIREFTQFTDNKYNKIIALEPDIKSYRKLERNTADMDNIETHNMGVWSKSDTLFFDNQSSRNSKLSGKGTPIRVIALDSFISSPVTMIKMDIEGSELQALNGAEKTIRKYLPKLYVCAYHRNEDMFTLPMKILELSDSYKLYFRHSPYIPAWESNFYCIAE